MVDIKWSILITLEVSSFAWYNI